MDSISWDRLRDNRRRKDAYAQKICRLFDRRYNIADMLETLQSYTDDFLLSRINPWLIAHKMDPASSVGCKYYDELELMRPSGTAFFASVDLNICEGVGEDGSVVPYSVDEGQWPLEHPRYTIDIIVVIAGFVKSLIDRLAMKSVCRLWSVALSRDSLWAADLNKIVTFLPLVDFNRFYPQLPIWTQLAQFAFVTFDEDERFADYFFSTHLWTVNFDVMQVYSATICHMPFHLTYGEIRSGITKTALTISRESSITVGGGRSFTRDDEAMFAVWANRIKQFVDDIITGAHS